jgi:hypothetical protein
MAANCAAGLPASVTIRKRQGDGRNPVLIGDAQRTRRWPVLRGFDKHPCMRGLRISQFAEAH